MPDASPASATPHAAPIGTRRRWLAASLLLFAVAAGCTGIETQQRRWIFQASHSPAAPPEPLARLATVRGMEDVWIDYRSDTAGRGIRLHALWANNDDPQAPLLLYLHGARRDVGGSALRIENMRELGFSVLAIDYRGFGYSTDEEPSEAGVVEDARAAWNWLGRQHPQRRRYLFGHSLGGAIALQLGAQLAEDRVAGAPAGVIVEGTFTSIGELLRTFRWGWLPISMLITERFDSLAAVERIEAPLLVVHGSADSLIPSRLGRRLYEHARVPKRFVLVDGGTHHSTNRRGANAYRAALHELFGIDGAS